MNKSLSKELRNQLSRVTLAARERAENAVRAALENLAVHEKDYRPHMGVGERELRNRLRAKGRSLGDTRDERSGSQGIYHLAEQAAYEHWHRLLFTRFLVENGLLYSDETFGSVPVTLKDCDELAPDAGARDGFDLACRFASRALPGVFRQDDPILEIRLAPNDESALRALLDSLPTEIFRSDDGLGWTYQFWQARRKDEVNASGKKIGADELPAVTQLFTEDYMVEFLLHNTIGAWWAGKLGPIHAANEEEARARVALPVTNGLGVTWSYLRLVRDERTKAWAPAAGTFPAWPAEPRLITFLDPCMGSGHFVVFALPLLARLRMEEEGLSAAQAIYATLRDNLFGLELDDRCAQIAAFNLALTAWKLSGYQVLPFLNLACSGLAPHAAARDWVELAGEDERLKNGMGRLYDLFRDAPVLGSLINPQSVRGDVIDADFKDLQPLVDVALAQERNSESHEMAVTASGLARAAQVLASEFTLVATNVPYLGRGKQSEVLMDYCSRVHPEAKPDLATCFLERCLDSCAAGGSVAVVTPLSWLFQTGLKKLRVRLLNETAWSCVAKLGSRAFQGIGGEVVTVGLALLRKDLPETDHEFSAIDVSDSLDPESKAVALASAPPTSLIQKAQLDNPEARIAFDARAKATTLLGDYCECYQGVVTGDISRWTLKFWELERLDENVWSPCRGPSDGSSPFNGQQDVLLWENGHGQLHEYAAQARDQLHDMHESGNLAWGRRGVVINRVKTLRAGLYYGEIFHNSVAAVVPRDPALLSRVWAFCSSPTFEEEVRLLSPSLGVTNRVLIQIPFDPDDWDAECPSPTSSDPTQWIFDGVVSGSERPLQTAVGRLLGYRWPRQSGSSFSDCPSVGTDGLDDLSDGDGIVCLSPIYRERSAAHRLRDVLEKSLGTFDERTLIACDTGRVSGSATLEQWLLDEFFDDHCQVFEHRPFIWHIWDGRKDGFHALVNYHKLDHSALQKLTYTYLGDWLRQQADDVKADKPGAADRLGAAQILQSELARILEGEAPYDIFVRWKPVTKQAVGWHPDLNDGVRVNIRPFMTALDVGKKGAGVLRSRPNIKWAKDKGNEPPGRNRTEYPWFWCDEEPDVDPKPGKTFTGHRWNNVHLTLGTKKAAAK